MSGYAGFNRLKKQKPEAAGSRGAVQASNMENVAHAVGPDATIADPWLPINPDDTQDKKAPTFAVSCESLENHTYRKGAPL
jgi:hypothetical protein